MIIYIRRITTGGSLWELVIDNRDDDAEQLKSIEIEAQKLWEERQRMEDRRHGTT